MKENNMPEKKTIARAHKDREEGKAPSTQAGEFVREEMDHIREGKHGARSTKQAIAIGLSKARRAGVKLPAPRKGKTSEKTREAAKRDLKKGKNLQRASLRQNDRGRRERPCNVKAEKLLRLKHSQSKRDPRPRRGQRQNRSAAAKKAARTKGPAKRSEAARKAAETRAVES
jgi:hypothetical protein